MFNHSRIGFIILALLLLGVSLSFSGGVYHWTDEKGTIHFTDDISKVPRQYLDQVKESEFPEESSREEEKSVEPEKDESWATGQEVLRDHREKD